MIFPIAFVAVLTLVMCWQIYRQTDSKLNGIIINALVIVTAGIVSLAIMNMSTGTSEAQDTSNIEILDSESSQIGSLNDEINATGAIAATRTVSLAFLTSAPVSEILVAEGDSVQAGQVLARLDASDLMPTVENASFNLQSQQITFNSMIADPRAVDLNVAEASLRAAELNFGGSSVLSGPGSTAAEIQALQVELAENRAWQTALQRDNLAENMTSAGTALENVRENVPVPGPVQDALDGYNATLAQLWTAEGNLHRADASMEQARGNYVAEINRRPTYGGISGARVQMLQAQQQIDSLLNGPDNVDLNFVSTDLAIANLSLAQAEIQMTYIELVAPFDGIITEMNLTLGEIPPPSKAVEMIDTSQFYVNLPIDEIDIMKVQAGQSVNFIVDALPDDDINGVIEHVALTPDINPLITTYNVRVAVNETQSAIRAGMSTTAQVIIASQDNAVILSDRFVFIDEATDMPYVIIQRNDGGLERLTVELGLRANGITEIVSGLASGQRVVSVSSSAIDSIPFRGVNNG